MKNAPAEHPLKIWRLKQRPPLTQGEVGDKIGLSDMAISKIEAGGGARRKNLAALCALTGLTVTDFYELPAIPAGRKGAKTNGTTTQTGGRGKKAPKAAEGKEGGKGRETASRRR